MEKNRITVTFSFVVAVVAVVGVVGVVAVVAFLPAIEEGGFVMLDSCWLKMRKKEKKKYTALNDGTINRFGSLKPKYVKRRLKYLKGQKANGCNLN